MEGKNRGRGPRPLGVYGQILLGFGAFTLVIDENGRLLADSYASQKQSPLRMTLAQGGLPALTILAQLYN